MNSLIVAGRKIADVGLVIFDKDGTIMDVHHYWGGMVRMRAEYLSKKFCKGGKRAADDMMDAMGIDLSKNRIKPEGPVGIKSRAYVTEMAHKALLRHCGTAKLQDVSDAFALIDKESLSRLDELVKPLPGVPEFLVELREKGIKAAIATTDMTERAHVALSKLGIDGLFDLVAGGDAVAKVKPAPDLVRFVEKKLSARPENSVLVGDSYVDMEMAKNAGTRFIGVKTGLCSRDFLEKAEYLADDLTGIRVG